MNTDTHRVYRIRERVLAKVVRLLVGDDWREERPHHDLKISLCVFAPLPEFLKFSFLRTASLSGRIFRCKLSVDSSISFGRLFMALIVTSRRVPLEKPYGFLQFPWYWKPAWNRCLQL